MTRTMITAISYPNVRARHLATRENRRHSWGVDDDEATTLMLETLFDIKVKVHEIHGAIFGEDDDEEEVEGDDA